MIFFLVRFKVVENGGLSGIVKSQNKNAAFLFLKAEKVYQLVKQPHDRKSSLGYKTRKAKAKLMLSLFFKKRVIAISLILFSYSPNKDRTDAVTFFFCVCCCTSLGFIFITSLSRFVVVVRSVPSNFSPFFVDDYGLCTVENNSFFFSFLPTFTFTL